MSNSISEFNNSVVAEAGGGVERFLRELAEEAVPRLKVEEYRGDPDGEDEECEEEEEVELRI